MIPIISPPFNLTKLVSFRLLPRRSPSTADLERKWAEALGMPETVLVPSVRSGMFLTLRAINAPDMLVVGPAYTCDVVHEAMFLSGNRLCFVDLSPGRFLMDRDAIVANGEPGSCVVFSELYGVRYGDDVLQATRGDRCRARFFDLAMSIPDPSRLKEMQRQDVAFFSFGAFKCLCAGGGGIVCFKDRELAHTVREVRDAWLVDESLMGRLRIEAKFLLGVLFRTRWLYGLAKTATTRRRSRYGLTIVRSEPMSPPSENKGTLGWEWTRPMSPLNRKIALYNLGKIESSAELRQRQAARYLANLTDYGVVSEIDEGSLPHSFFPIRVERRQRDPLVRFLIGHGVGAGMLFKFSKYLERTDFPGAVCTSEEILTLPLGEGMSLDEIDYICGQVGDGLREVQ